MFVVPQKKLERCEQPRANSMTLGFTERIHIRGNARLGPSPSSKPRGREQQRQCFRFPIQRASYRIVQACLVRAILHRLVQSKEEHNSTLLCVWYTRDPKAGFPTEGSDKMVGAKWRHELTSPFPSRTVAGRAHSSLVCSRMSTYVWPTMFWIL